MRVDTIRLNCPLDEKNISMLNLSHERVTKHTTQKMVTKEVIDTHTINTSGIIGLNSVKIQSNDTCLIQLSAKSLKANYKNLLSNDNIEEALNQVNQLECLQINIPEVIESAICFRADPCIDFIPDGYTKEELFNVLSAVSNRNYCIRPYQYDGITLMKNAKSNTCRLIVYDKSKEVMKDRELLPYIGSEDFQDSIRCEFNLRAFSYMRKYFNLPAKGNKKLSEILDSETTPNLTFWNEFEKPVKHKDLHDIAMNAKTTEQFNAILAQKYLAERGMKKANIETMLHPLFKNKSNARAYMRRTAEPIIEAIKNEVDPKFNRILSHFKKCISTHERN